MWDKKDIKPRPIETPISQPNFVDARPIEPSAEVVRVGRSIVIKGEISGAQDLTLEGRLEGKIELKDNRVTISESGIVNGEIFARQIAIQGQVVGNVYAEERVEIKSSGSLRGDIVAPRLIIEDGAYFKGSVEMDLAREQKAKPASVLSLIQEETPTKLDA